MRRIWAVLALIAALTLPSVVAAVVLPADTAHAQPKSGKRFFACTQGAPAAFCP